MNFPFMVFNKHITFHMVSHQRFALSDGAKKQIMEKEHGQIHDISAHLDIWFKQWTLKLWFPFIWPFHGCIIGQLREMTGNRTTTSLYICHFGLEQGISNWVQQEPERVVGNAAVVALFWQWWHMSFWESLRPLRPLCSSHPPPPPYLWVEVQTRSRSPFRLSNVKSSGWFYNRGEWDKAAVSKFTISMVLIYGISDQLLALEFLCVC